MNPKDIIKLNVPLFLRLLEYAKEDAKTDMDLHKVTENIIQLASSGQVLGMQEYQMIVGDHDELNEEFIRMQELAGLSEEDNTEINPLDKLRLTNSIHMRRVINGGGSAHDVYEVNNDGVKLIMDKLKSI